MHVTAKLLAVFKVDKELHGLEERLRQAERFLGEQTRHAEDLGKKQTTLEAQLKQMQADVANREGEMARLDAKMDALREQMNTAQTNKQYKAFLTEVNTFKAERGTIETGALELMTRMDEIRAQVADLARKRDERLKLAGVAADDRAKRASDIREQVEKLRADRAALAKEVPADVLKQYAELWRIRGEEAMSPVEVMDRKRHEYTCGSCMMTLPMEVPLSLVAGRLNSCPACRSLLFLSVELTEMLTSAGSKR